VESSPSKTEFGADTLLYKSVGIAGFRHSSIGPASKKVFKLLASYCLMHSFGVFGLRGMEGSSEVMSTQVRLCYSKLLTLFAAGFVILT